ncbi:H-NS histone family protein [Burkholderia vietnamiensis]|uniref:H-NS histone family protein n=1 Tax=Burkholderia vietnamiensis TaxID=60552 RepID=UPI0009BDA65B|nr:H-NS histone family protein [Burkholderia vietnamiensis]MBR8083331.1 H-NS histone family protein [Burkholderia vietnamiensis]MDN7816502.1 H-NS histone family protein [Burkholderia vietnamiensis]HDR9084573.1 H-NS histone family protein [Burkholderia vietnamiensis]
MATYTELKTQLDALQQETEAARIAELQTVIEQVRNVVQQYGLTTEDVFGRQLASGGKAAKAPLPPKYRDPKTGATWSGRGRTPTWLQGKKLERLLIESE